MPTAKPPVYGHVVEPCKVTRSGLILALTRIALPFVLALAALDAIIWAVARYGFDTCYGVWCWF